MRHESRLLPPRVGKIWFTSAEVRSFRRSLCVTRKIRHSFRGMQLESGKTGKIKRWLLTKSRKELIKAIVALPFGANKIITSADNH
jgi:hypothetical protein